MSLEDTIRRIAGNPLPANEEAAKFHAIVPILEELGWDVYNQDGGTEVEYERPVGPGRGQRKTGRADIALMKTMRGKRQCAALIEAKAPPKKLEDHVDQLIAYAFHEGVDICVLTDSQKWWLYLPMQKGRIADRRFIELDIKDSPERVADELEQFLSKKNIFNGESEKRAKRRLAALKDAGTLNATFPDVWREMLSEPDPGLVELLSSRISDTIGLRPSRAQIASLLAEEEVSLTTVEESKLRTMPGKPTKLVITQKSKEKMPKMTSFSLWDKAYPAKQYTKIPLTVLDLLWRKHSDNFVKIKEWMWSSNVWFSRQLIANDRSKLREVKSVPISTSGYFFDKDTNPEFLVEVSCAALEVFGYNSDDLKIETTDGKSHTAKKLSNAVHEVNCSYSAAMFGKSMFGKSFLFYQYNSILKCLCEILWDRHNVKFKQLFDKTWYDGGGIFLSTDKNKFSKPYEIANSGHYVMATLKQPYLDRAQNYMLEQMGYSATDLQIQER